MAPCVEHLTQVVNKTGNLHPFRVTIAPDALGYLEEVVNIAREGLLPLYRLYVEDYAPRLDACGEAALARGMRQWRERLN